MINENLPIVFTLNGIDYPFHSDFREWIRFDGLLNNSDVPEVIKPELMLNLIFAGKPPKDEEAAMRYILWFYNGGHEARKSNNSETYLESRRIYDFEYDFDYIYAAFMELYGIDLVDVPYLHWWKFIALFKGLHDCRISEIMGYRGAKINDDMPKSRQEFLMDMQDFYKLPVSLAEQRRIEEAQRFLNG